MTTFPLQLRMIDAVAGTPAAWLIPGDDPSTWLAEIGQWGVPMPGLRLFVLPHSLRDRRPTGVLVIVSDAIRSEAVRRGQPYRLLAGRLYVPVGAALDPPVSDDELTQKLAWEIQVLHPSIGLIGYRRAEGLRVGDLLAPPKQIEADWDRAARPIVVAPRLLSVRPEQPPTMEILLEMARGDIGSESPDKLPPTADESAIRHFLKRAGKPGYKAIERLASAAPGGAADASLMARLARWAKRHLDEIERASLNVRFRELRRLQKLFETSTDEALRFAIPFRDTGSRGRASPGNRLGARKPTFDVSRLRGGQPADPWFVPNDIRNDLLARYRAAANRELSLERYRRAAYVFAELLGDYAAAANALQQGRFFRDAATLYRDKLGNKPAAAKCLKNGGLLIEAIVLYEELGEYEHAGDLYAQIERPDEARRCYRVAVERAIGREAMLEAAKLLEFKLDAPDEAEKLLISQWPGSRGAVGCLSAYFEILSRRNRHKQAHRRLAWLRDAPLPTERIEPLAQILSMLATTYPEPAVRALAADATRVIVGRRLAAVRGAEAKTLVSAVTRLCPEDRLLCRDGARYVEAGPPVYKLAPLSPRSRLVFQFRLPAGPVWKAATSIGDTFFALGVEPAKGCVLLRGRWDGTVQTIPWGAMRYSEACSLQPSSTGQSLLLIPTGHKAEPNRAIVDFPCCEGSRGRCQTKVPAWLPTELILGAGQDENDTLWLGHGSGEPSATVSAFHSDTGLLLATLGPVELEAGPPDGLWATTPVALVARRGHVFLGNGRGIWHWRPGRAGEMSPRRIDLPGPMIAMAASPALTRARVAIAFDTGGAMLWTDGTLQRFGQGMEEPKIAFTRGGLLVAVAAGEARVYRTSGSRIELQASFPLDGPAPLAVCAATKLEEFGVIGADGAVRVFALSGERELPGRRDCATARLPSL